MDVSQVKTVSVIGLGYIGLPTAATIANSGVDVVGVDINERNVALLNQGKVHFFEPDLDAIVTATVGSGHLRATTQPEAADAFVIAVPTPIQDDKSPDLTYVDSAARSIAPVLRKGDLVVLESTSPVGTTERMARIIGESRPDLTMPVQGGTDGDIFIAYCPERILPGRMVQELVENDRVIGGMTPACTARAISLYKLFVKGQCFPTSARAAELVKLVENSFRDVNIAFANELSLICDRFDLNVWQVIALANRHPRVNILQPGPGVGGHCIAVDPWFIVDSAPDLSKIIRAAREINDHKPHYILGRIDGMLAGSEDPVIACLGLAYKADVDDLRESPAMEITAMLAERGARVLAVEPNIEKLPASLERHGNLSLVSLDEALEQADAVLLLVDHKPFRELDRSRLEGLKVYDTKGIWQDRV